MNHNIERDILRGILRDHLDTQKQAEILNDINNALAEEKETEEKPPKIEKKQVVIITGMPPGFEEKDVENLAGFITEIPAENPTRDIKYSLRETAETYKTTRKAKKNPADCLAELFELAPAALFKENGILKKPKGPLEFVSCPNR